MNFSGEPPRHGVYGYFDASHADDIDTRRLYFLLLWSNTQLAEQAPYLRDYIDQPQ